MNLASRWLRNEYTCGFSVLLDVEKTTELIDYIVGWEGGTQDKLII